MAHACLTIRKVFKLDFRAGFGMNIFCKLPEIPSQKQFPLANHKEVCYLEFILVTEQNHPTLNMPKKILRVPR